MNKQFTISCLLMLMISIILLAASYPIDVTTVLQQAGSNRRELQNVLDHYASDTLKYNAACFLIANMYVHSSQTYYWADSLGEKFEFDEFSYPNFESAVSNFNSLSAKTKLHAVKIKENDIEEISASYLIGNIDRAFKLKDKPWAQGLSFDQFCEYLLSYRILNEPFSEWRESFLSTFSNYSSQVAGQRVRKVCTFLSDSLRSWFFNTYSLTNKQVEPAYLSPSQILFRKQGACEDMANWGVYLLRSIGIASTIDFTPAWGTSTGGHYWNVALNEFGEPIPFFMGDDNPNEFLMLREPSKVFRVTYGVQKNTLACNAPSEKIPEGFMRNINYLDVTNEYWKVSNLSVELFPEMVGQKIAFVSVLNGLKWQPVWWSNIKDGRANFTDLSCGVVYLPMCFQNDKMITACSPCLLLKDASIKILAAQEYHLRDITITQQKDYLIFRSGKKYTLFYWNKRWQKHSEQTIVNDIQLTFKGVPSNALLLLVPEYSVGKERPFTIDDQGKIEWW